MKTNSTHTKALDLLERRRKADRLSVRKAAERAGISEANWRQLAAGSVRQGDRVVARPARPDQLLSMAAAVGVLDQVAELLGAAADEVEAARGRVIIRDPAEEEIMASRHMSAEEKLYLLKSLQAVRDDVG